MKSHHLKVYIEREKGKSSQRHLNMTVKGDAVEAIKEVERLFKIGVVLPAEGYIPTTAYPPHRIARIEIEEG